MVGQHVVEGLNGVAGVEVSRFTLVPPFQFQTDVTTFVFYFLCACHKCILPSLVKTEFNIGIQLPCIVFFLVETNVSPWCNRICILEIFIRITEGLHLVALVFGQDKLPVRYI